jgi:hypothetical protein
MAAADRIDNATYVQDSRFHERRDRREAQSYGNQGRRSYASSTAPSPMELGNLYARGNVGNYGTPPHPQGNSRWTSNGNRPRLSPEERQRLMDANACFNCKEPGHLARDSPKRSKRSGPNGRAPGRR